MATIIRSTISEKNKYYVEKHRYYELKHFCLQYGTWKKAYASLDAMRRNHSDLASYIKTNIHSDTTLTIVEALLEYRNKIEMVERAALKTDSELHTYILKAVTEELSYPYLKLHYDIPCSRDTYYDRYRKFFYILNSIRE